MVINSFYFFCLSTETEQSDFGEHGKETVKKYREIFCIFIVLTIFFTLAVARFVFAPIKVFRPKSDRLSARKKKTSCFFLVHKTTHQSRKFFASSTEIFQKNEKIYSKSQESCEFDRYPLGKKGETAMKKQYKITTIGTPNIEKMSMSEQKSFYSTLLSLMTEYFRNNAEVKSTNAPDCSENANGINSG